MAAYTKIADSEMNYYQFKAKQIVLQKKEDKEWKDFCKQSASECAACLAENENVRETKDIGIQALPRRLVNKIEQTSVQPRYQNKQAEALNHIKDRLEKIDLTLSNLFDASHEMGKEKEPTLEQKNMYIPTNYPKVNPPPFEEQRKLFIRKSLEASLSRLHNSQSTVPRKPSTIKPRNSSFFLPHDLQVKRASARKAYLASLQTKPKVSFQKVRESNVKKPQPAPNKNVAPPRKKSISKVHKKTNVNEVKTVLATVDVKDENIDDSVVNDILGDLIQELALDVHNVMKRKQERYSAIKSRNINVEKENELLIPLGSLISSPLKNNNPQIIEKDASRGLTSLKPFFHSSIAQPEKTDLRNEQSVDKSTSTHPVDLKPLHHEPDLENALPHTNQIKNEIKAPKFVCGVSHIIAVDPEKAKEISHNRNRFWRYLKNISRLPKGNFHPWTLNEMLAESILDGCIYDIAEELSENFAQELYNQEFAQQVES